MNKLDKLKTRIIIAKSVGWKPDDIRVIDSEQRLGRTLYALDDFKGHNICLGFCKVPTIKEARYQVKNLYLCGIEWDFDEEFDSEFDENNYM